MSVYKCHAFIFLDQPPPWLSRTVRILMSESSLAEIWSPGLIDYITFKKCLFLHDFRLLSVMRRAESRIFLLAFKSRKIFCLSPREEIKICLFTRKLTAFCFAKNLCSLEHKKKYEQKVVCKIATGKFRRFNLVEKTQLRRVTPSSLSGSKTSPLWRGWVTVKNPSVGQRQARLTTKSWPNLSSTPSDSRNTLYRIQGDDLAHVTFSFATRRILRNVTYFSDLEILIAFEIGKTVLTNGYWIELKGLKGRSHDFAFIKRIPAQKYHVIIIIIVTLYYMQWYYYNFLHPPKSSCCLIPPDTWT